jgi:hypothetical protein
VIKVRLSSEQIERIILDLVAENQSKVRAIQALAGTDCQLVGDEFELSLDSASAPHMLQVIARADGDGSGDKSDRAKPAPEQGVAHTLRHDLSEPITGEADDHADPSMDIEDEQDGPNPFLATSPDGVTFFHECAREHRLREIPLELWTPGIWSAADQNGETFVHWAARHGCLDQIPRQFHDPDLMLIDDNIHETFLHKAAFSGFILQAPQRMLVEEFLLVENRFGQNCLHRAAYGGNIGLLPQKMLIPEFLELTDQNGDNVYSLAAKSGCLDHIPASQNAWGNRD